MILTIKTSLIWLLRERLRYQLWPSFAFDTDLMIEQIKELWLASVDIPTYDYVWSIHVLVKPIFGTQRCIYCRRILVLEISVCETWWISKFLLTQILMFESFAGSSEIWKNVVVVWIALLNNIWVLKPMHHQFYWADLSRYADIIVLRINKVAIDLITFVEKILKEARSVRRKSSKELDFFK